MVTFELLNESAEDLRYAYHPEGDRHHAGIVTYNPNTHATHIIEHATTDHGAHYAHRLAHHLATASTPMAAGTLD